jgi:hypothetical protein
MYFCCGNIKTYSIFAACNLNLQYEYYNLKYKYKIKFKLEKKISSLFKNIFLNYS